MTRFEELVNDFTIMGDDGAVIFAMYDLFLEFVEEIRADEREACAKLCEPTEEHRRDASWGYLGGNEGVELLDNIARAIRARGEK